LCDVEAEAREDPLDFYVRDPLAEDPLEPLEPQRHDPRLDRPGVLVDRPGHEPRAT
jgi:hypothetical protein